MGLFNRNKSKNWGVLQGRDPKERGRSRDVHGGQDLERGSRGEATKPTKQRVAGFMLGLVFGAMGFAVGYGLLTLQGFVSFIREGSSFLDFKASELGIMDDWKIYAFTAFVFLIAWLIANERMMAIWRAENSMVDSTDINSHENDQHIMLPEEMHRAYDWFPDTGAHSSVQVSSMLSHVMIDRKGLKRIDFTERYAKNGADKDGIKVYKGEPKYDADGYVIQSRQPIIDEEFGQELFTASGIRPDEKDVRQPIDVRKIEYNPVNDTGARKDRDKQSYDTVAELINEDWEFPDYEVQRPAGAYLVDTAPVNTMV